MCFGDGKVARRVPAPQASELLHSLSRLKLRRGDSPRHLRVMDLKKALLANQQGL